MRSIHTVLILSKWHGKEKRSARQLYLWNDRTEIISVLRPFLHHCPLAEHNQTTALYTAKKKSHSNIMTSVFTDCKLSKMRFSIETRLLIKIQIVSWCYKYVVQMVLPIYCNFTERDMYQRFSSFGVLEMSMVSLATHRLELPTIVCQENYKKRTLFLNIYVLYCQRV